MYLPLKQMSMRHFGQFDSIASLSVLCLCSLSGPGLTARLDMKGRKTQAWSKLDQASGTSAPFGDSQASADLPSAVILCCVYMTTLLPCIFSE